VPDQRQERGSSLGRLRRRRETPLELAERIANAYGLVLLLILVTFVVMMTLPPEGWGGRVAAVAIAVLTAVVALTSSDVRPSRVRTAVVVAAATVRAALIAKATDSDRVLGAAFLATALLLAIAAATILRRVISTIRVDFRTILGAISVYALLGLLFALLYFGFSRWNHSEFFTGVANPRSSDYVFFSYTTLTTTGYGNLIPAGTVGQSVTVIEMLLGQIFLVTLIAGLVSLWRPGAAKAPAD
jgi:hypothetical protein